ncbi:MAG: class I SAM-dependent methyltransferase [Kofleriaceae bacterium]
MSATEHRVASHLGVSTADYDAQIRRWIPHYDEMLATVVSLLDRHIYVRLPAGATPIVTDLGAGTGALSAAVLDGVPGANVVLVDIDPAMLDAARARLTLPLGSRTHTARAELRRSTFTDGLSPSDAVVASLALHHVVDLADKRALYRSIHAALRPGGVLLIADATVHAEGPEHDAIYRYWAAHMATHGIGADEAAQLFAQWAKEDTYRPLATELALLAEAGFTRPDAFWKRGPMTVYGGFRP